MGYFRIHKRFEQVLNEKHKTSTQTYIFKNIQAVVREDHAAGKLYGECDLSLQLPL